MLQVIRLTGMAILVAVFLLTGSPDCQYSVDIPRAGVYRGDRLLWDAIDSNLEPRGYAARVLKADWDGDGADELLLPVLRSSGTEIPLLYGRSVVLELDGSARLVPLNGYALRSNSVVWDFDRDGFPEIATDYYGYAMVETTRRTRAIQTTADPGQLEQFEKTETAFNTTRNKLTELKPGSSDYFDKANGLFKQLDAVELLYSGLDYKEYPNWDEYNRAIKGVSKGFAPGTTVILNLSGKLLATLDGSINAEFLSAVANVSGSHWPELVLEGYVDAGSSEDLPSVKVHRFYGAGGKQLGMFSDTDGPGLACLADIDGDQVAELLSASYIVDSGGAYSGILSACRLGSRPQPVDLSAAELPENYTEPATCLDLDADGSDDVLSWDWRLYSVADKVEIALEKPRGWEGAERMPVAWPAPVEFAMIPGKQRLAWLPTATSYFPTGLAAYAPTGKLEYFEEFGEELLQVCTAVDSAGNQVLIVQTATRILVWPSGGRRSTGMMALAGR